jgi:hypothetical protein
VVALPSRQIDARLKVKGDCPNFGFVLGGCLQVRRAIGLFLTQQDERWTAVYNAAIQIARTDSTAFFSEMQKPGRLFAVITSVSTQQKDFANCQPVA